MIFTTAEIATQRVWGSSSLTPILEQSGCSRPERNAEMLVGQTRHDAPAGRALQEADLQQIRFVHVLDRVDLFAEHGGDCVYPDRAAIKSLDDRAQQLSIDVIKALLVDIQ